MWRNVNYNIFVKKVIFVYKFFAKKKKKWKSLKDALEESE